MEIELSQADIEKRAEIIEEALASYGVEAKIVQINVGPTVTQFGVEPGWERNNWALAGATLEPKEVLSLVNGETTKGALRDLLGARGDEPSLVQEALDRAVAEKDKKLLFGVLVMTMALEGDVDPSSEFCRVVGGSRGLDDKQFEKLCRGNVGTSFIRECFGFTSKDDQKDMQRFLLRTWDSPYLLHPLGASLAKRGGVTGTFDAKKFPKPAAGMPGCGDEYKSGEAGGLPFDKGLPPVPYYGENLEEFFE